MRRIHRTAAIAGLLIAGSTAGVQAQNSASFKLQESVLNAGGHPEQGTTLSSAGFRVRLDALGQSVAAPLLGGPSFHLEAGFVSAYPPPGEVRNLLFPDRQTLVWNPERSIGRYEVYRGPLASASAGGTGICFASNLPAPTTTDASSPASGQGFLYLITARNRLGEEGTKGYRTNGVERPNPAPCP
ncbi:MAG TPA: hypothetical protein VJS92_03230 [Candidatus Polarisedimenticolaceae bacterium]|nr:hypothetical protein [Candidatus Polarisedimenticolaceae bacterium]